MDSEQTIGSNVVMQNDSQNVQLSSNLLQRGLDDLNSEQKHSGKLRQARSECEEFYGLTDASIEIALEKPPLWEHRLFLQVVADEVRKHRFVRSSDLVEVIIDSAEKVERININEWVSALLNEVFPLIDKASLLISQHVQKALGPVGHPGNVRTLIHVGIELGTIYRQFCEWSVRAANTPHDKSCDKLFQLLPRIVEDIIQSLETFGADGLALIDEVLTLPKTEEHRNIEQTLNLKANMTISNEVFAEVRRLILL